MWIILFSALDDFGIKELNAGIAHPDVLAEIDVVKRKVADEALHGALRIAGLAGVLTSNGYLVSKVRTDFFDQWLTFSSGQRLDPAVMLVSCILAGTLLARLGRPEVSNCIAGLEQYSYAYEEAGDQAHEMSRLFQRVRFGDLELNHMASIIPRVAPASPPVQSNTTMLDTQIHRTNGSSHVTSF